MENEVEGACRDIQGLGFRTFLLFVCNKERSERERGHCDTANIRILWAASSSFG